MIEYTTKVGAHDWDGFTELEMGGGGARGGVRRGKQFVVRRLDEYYYDLVRRDGPPGVSAVHS